MTDPDLEQRALRRIPGGTQLLSKRPEMFAPGQWPRYYSRARGVRTWDLDGNEYLDMSSTGIGACVLGFADQDVDDAARRAIDAGSMATLNCPEELELADLLCELHPWADMVRYTRAGGEALAVAVRIARTVTRRSLVVFCGYHGWHDWYLAANLARGDALDGHWLPGLDPAGVPRELAGTALPFGYNNLGELEDLLARHRDRVAAVVMEPARGGDPAPGFLAGVRELARDAGAVLIFDEVTSGLRLVTGGVHLHYGVTPDVAVFAKALGNGYPIGAVIGVGRVMTAAQQAFVSSTSWTERIGPAAALATLRKHRANRVGDHLVRIGARVQDGWRRLGATANVKVTVGGLPPLATLAFEGSDGQATATLFTQLMLDRGFLAGRGFYASFAHQDHHIDAYLEAAGEVFGILGEAVAAGDVRRRLRGPVAHTGFRRLV